jgi:hypothetical protein
MVSSLAHWWHLDEDVVFTNSPFQQGTPPREVPDAMGRRFAWRGTETSYSANAAVPGLVLPEKDPATNLAGAFVIPIGAKPLPALKNAFTLEWKMAFPAFGGQYLSYQAPAAGMSSLACALGGNDVIDCELNGTKVGFKIDAAAYTGQHAWALAYDRGAQTVSLFFDGQPVPMVAGSLVSDWQVKLDATENLAFLGTGKTIADVRLWDRALTSSEVANEFAKGSCSVVDPLRFNFKGDPGWKPGNARPTNLYPADVAEPGFLGFGQPPLGAQDGQGADAFYFTQLSPSNMAWLAITTPRTFRVDHVTSYHDANVDIPFTLVAEVSAQGETDVTSASGWRKLYARQPGRFGESVNENVASPPSLTAGSYMVRFRPEVAPDPSTTQVSTAWFYMVGTRMP